MTAIAKKRIFISDIHMGDARSFDETIHYPYCWFRTNIDCLTSFLKELLTSTDLEEVVILGDLFDRWIIPTNQNPLTGFQSIIECKKNKPVITALKELAKNHKLTYVPGNHDMSLSDEERDVTRKFMEATFDNIKYDPDNNGKYFNGTIVGEHGNYFTFFNAPDKSAKRSSVLPLGYFISRVQAYKLAKFGKKDDFFIIFRNLIREKMSDKDRFIKNLYEAWATHAQLEKTAHIKMKGIAGFPDTVEAIGTLYENLIKQWDDQRKDIDWHTAVAGDLGDLAIAASHVHLRPPGSKHNIVIFGHTHNAEMWTNIICTDRLFLTTGKVRKKTPNRSIYANCGTWVDPDPKRPRPCTYVETEEDAEAGRHYVRLWTYPAKELLKERFVKLY
jgi:UDP-2,3-diacylglucosamine pyrophosphatase LpxH